jgi:hypothetical protein
MADNPKRPRKGPREESQRLIREVEAEEKKLRATTDLLKKTDSEWDPEAKIKRPPGPKAQ